jgi:hypothetical protein
MSAGANSSRPDHDKRKNRLRLAALALIFFAATLLFLDVRQQSTRLTLVTATAHQISRGNYFAWAQARCWEREYSLTADERALLRDACQAFARTNAVLLAKNQIWPPSDVQIRTASLQYDRNLCLPAFNHVPTAFFDGIFGLQFPDGR